VEGAFITFEGGEGVGKTTQIKLLGERLRAGNRDVVETREPGGTELGKSLRSTILQTPSDPGKDGRNVAPLAELFLLLADRAQHIRDIILPNVAAGKVVLCDRYADSTVAYQGYARGFDLVEVRRLNALVCGNCRPNVTFLMDLPTEMGIERAVRRRGARRVDNFEAESVVFHRRVRAGFLSIAEKELERFCVIDGSGTIARVHGQVVKLLRQRMPSLFPQ